MTTALLLIAHGSRQTQANQDLHYLAEQLRQRGNSIVVASFLELAEPSIEEGGRQCVAAGASRVVMTPYFLSAGVHVRRDLTEARNNLSAEFPQVDFLLAEPLGRHPLLIELVEMRIAEKLKQLQSTPVEDADLSRVCETPLPSTGIISG